MSWLLIGLVLGYLVYEVITAKHQLKDFERRVRHLEETERTRIRNHNSR